MKPKSDITIVTSSPKWFFAFEEAGFDNVILVAKTAHVEAAPAELKKLALRYASFFKHELLDGDHEPDPEHLMTGPEFLCPECLTAFDLRRGDAVACPNCGGLEALPVVEEDED